jgi:hypothetical protein
VIDLLLGVSVLAAAVVADRDDSAGWFCGSGGVGVYAVTVDAELVTARV